MNKNYNFSHNIKYPQESKELIKIFDGDQTDIIENMNFISKLDSETEKKYQYSLLASRRNNRANRMLEILNKVGKPTVQNIGVDGSEAVALIALHSSYEIIETILKLYETIFKNDPDSIYVELIPSLYDRIMIRNKRKQKYGTHWLIDSAGNPFLVEVDEFIGMNKRRSMFGLKPTRRPVNLAKGAEKYPLGRGLARESDQKKLTNSEYNDFIKVYSFDSS